MGSLQLVSRAVAGTSRKTAIQRLPCRTSDAAGHEGYGTMKSVGDGDESGCRVTRLFERKSGEVLFAGARHGWPCKGDGPCLEQKSREKKRELGFA